MFHMCNSKKMLLHVLKDFENLTLIHSQSYKDLVYAELVAKHELFQC